MKIRRFLLGLVATALISASACAQYGTSTLYNRSGSTVSKFDVVIWDTSNSNSFKTTTTSRDTKVLGIVGAASIANNTTGLVVQPGAVIKIRVTGAVTRGDYLVTSTTAGAAASGGTSDSSGAFAIALESGTNTNVNAYLIFSSGLLGTGTITPAGVTLLDNTFLTLGTDSDFKWTYDEAGDDRLEAQDASGNVMFWLKDGGSTAVAGVEILETNGIRDVGETETLMEFNGVGSAAGYVGFNGRIAGSASTTSRATATIPHGTAPSAPNNGDLWSTTLGLYFRANGNTVGPFIGAGADATAIYAGDTVSNDVTGTFEADGDTVLTVVDDSHNHVITNIDAFTEAELETQLSDVTNIPQMDDAETISADWVNTANPWADNEVADILTVGSGSTVADGALSTNVLIAGDQLTGDVTVTFEADGATAATVVDDSHNHIITNIDSFTEAELETALSDVTNIPQMDDAETISGNWVNTANPWADNEVADILTIGAGSTVADSTLSTNVMVAGDALTGDVTVTFEADGSTVAAIGSGVIVNGDVHTTAAIAETKLAIARSYWMSGGAVWPAASGGCNTPALDANNNVACAFPASTTGYISVPIPSNYDGSTENIRLYWYKATDTNSVTWTIDSVVIDDNGDETATTATGTITNTAGPTSATNVQIDSPTSAAFFGTSANAGKWARIKITTNAYSGGTASLMGIKVEY